MSELVWIDDVTPFRIYPPDEAWRAFGPIAERIFGPRESWVMLHKRTTPLFADPDWIALAVYGDFLSCHKEYPDIVEGDDGPRFIDEPDSGFAFPADIREDELDAVRNALWTVHIEKYAGPDPFAPLFRHMLEQGRHELIQFNWVEGGQSVTCYPVRCILDRTPTFDDERFGRLRYRYFFDRGGRWGVFADHDEVCLIGGAPDVMAQVADALGGMAAIKARMDAHVMQYASWPTFDTMAPAYRAIGWESPKPD